MSHWFTEYIGRSEVIPEAFGRKTCVCKFRGKRNGHKTHRSLYIKSKSTHNHHILNYIANYHITIVRTIFQSAHRWLFPPSHHTNHTKFLEPNFPPLFPHSRSKRAIVKYTRAHTVVQPARLKIPYALHTLARRYIIAFSARLKVVIAESHIYIDACLLRQRRK